MAGYTVFPILQDLGQIGLEREVAFPGLYTADFGGGYRATAGLNDEVMTFKLNWQRSCRDVSLIEDEFGVMVDRVSYIWNFYRNRMREMNSPFIIEDVCENTNLTSYNASGETGRTQYLVTFADTKLSQRQVQNAYTYSYGLTVKQYRQAGLIWGQINAPNPQTI